jgi:hypothetical protein
MPVAGRLVACSVKLCNSLLTDGLLATFEGPIAQLGYVNVLPFRTRTFGSNTFAAEFAANGSLKSAGYEQKAAPAEVASGAVADTVGQLADVLSPTARLNASTTYLKALKDQRDAYESTQPDPNAAASAQASALGADTALLNAKIANLNAQIALQELEAKQLSGR